MQADWFAEVYRLDILFSNDSNDSTMAGISAALADLKKGRTAAYTALKKAALSLRTAVDQGQSIILTCLQNLELKWSEFEFHHQELSDFLAAETLPDGDTSVVNGKDMDAYYAETKSFYDVALKAYKLYLTQPKSDSSSLNAGLSSHVQPFVSNPDSSFRSYKSFQDPPSWDGKPGRSWLEFKASWVTEVVPLYKNRQLALARLLKKQISGDARTEIEHVSLSDSTCYELMWSALESRYDNVALNVYVVLSVFDKLRPCTEDDFCGTLTFFRKISAAHAQLQSLKQVDEVDMMRVSRISGLLPRSIQVLWAKKVTELTDKEKYHPFAKFKEFLDSHVKTLESMKDISNTSKFYDTLHGSTSRSNPPRSSARSHNTTTDASARECVLHPGGNSHVTKDCRQFVKMDARERFNIACKHNLCKRCLNAKHGTCTQKCKTCQSDTHHEMLCFKGQDNQASGKSETSISKPYGSPNVRPFNPPAVNTMQLVDPNTGAVYNFSPQHLPVPSAHSTQQFYTAPSAASNPNLQGAQMTQTYMPHTGQVVLTSQSGTDNPSPSSASTLLAHGLNYAGSHAAPPGSAVAPNGQGAGHVIQQPPLALPNHTQAGISQDTVQNLKPIYIEGLGVVYKSPAGVNSTPSTHKASVSTAIFKTRSVNKNEQLVTDSQAYREHLFGIFAILSCPIMSNPNTHAVIFFDSGSDSSLVTEEGAVHLGARLIKRGFMDMTTLHGTQTVPTKVVEVTLRLPDGSAFPVVAYTMPKLCGMPDQVDEAALADLFPKQDPSVLQRPDKPVNLLLGADYFQLHPKREVASVGNLSIMQSTLGLCLQGAHPRVSKEGVSSQSPNPYHGVRLSFRESFGASCRFRLDTPTHALLQSPPVSVHLGTAHNSEVEDSISGQMSLPDQYFSTSESLSPVTSSTELCIGGSPEEPTHHTLPPPDRVTSDVPLPVVRESSNPAQYTSGDAKSYAVHHHQPHCPVTVVAARVNSGPDVEAFIYGENLGTACFPQCGACKCGRCPLPGHTYSFKEEQELALIQSKLRYIPDPGKWITGYPWIIDPRELPDNYSAAYSTLLRTERTLMKEPEWMATYQRQIDDHVDRGVARKLTAEEIAAYEGPYFYLSHMAIEQPKSESTPVRLVFNSSQKFQGVSLNDCLAKGPDAYNNSLLGMLIRFREHVTVLIGDIKKMYNTVELELLEQHMHRFLWRSCQQDIKPEVWVITRVNLGDRPSGTIAITAKNNTAHMFSHIDEEAAVMIVYCSYTDDLINSIPQGMDHARHLSSKCEEILSKGNFKVKCWTYGGKFVPDEFKKKEPQQVLGTFYDATRDCIFFPAKINFSPKKRNVPTGPNLVASDVPQGIPDGLTRRIVLSQVMGIYDPLGLLSPLVLQAKLLLRQTWQGKLSWDEVLSESMVKNWKAFFVSLFEAAKIEFDRCLTPDSAVGKPQLIILSDGSEEAYGCAAYIRWELEDGTFWCTLIMAKSRIAPINRVSIPQMELNGAVINKRIRDVITSESRFEFEKVHQLVDSETVLCQLYKVAHKFHVFEGVRIGEIQAATGGDMSEWGWVSGENNIADLTTRPQPASALGPGTPWMSGPAFLYLPESEWPVKRNPRVSDREQSPGEKLREICSNACVCFCDCSVFCTIHDRCHSASNKLHDSLYQKSLARCSNTDIVLGAFARILSSFERKSFSGGNSQHVKPKHRTDALKLMLEDAQCSVWSSKKEVKKHFRHINIELREGLWVVTTRDPRQTNLSPDHQPQVILPPGSPITYRLMRDAHEHGRHAGRDATLSHFRARYHTSRAHRLADAVVKACTSCRRSRARLGKQKMGPMPVERLMRSPPFDCVILDLFGPYMCRGDKNPRVSNVKVWGVIIVDMTCRAVHLEVTPGYDTGSFLVSFRRYAAIRGWPSKVFSDPGTQLVGASSELVRSWGELRKTDGVLVELSRHGTEWIFGPSDSPWYQGAAEALIKSAKAAIRQALNGRRLSSLELLSAFSEVANLLNERPIGFSPGLDNELNILTPNNLLLGRSSSSNPGGYHSDTSLLSRVTAVRELVDAFWTSWTQLYAPTLLRQSKWTQEERPLRKGDIVLVADQNTVRGEFRLARVGDVHPSEDGIVRRVDIEYVIYRTMTKKFELVDGRVQSVPRSVQRLALIIPVEELPSTSVD